MLWKNERLEEKQSLNESRWKWQLLLPSMN